MVNFQNLVAQTRMFLDEVSEKSWKETEVEREVNYSYQDFVSGVVTTYEDFYLAKNDYNLVNLQQEYGIADGLPSNILKIRRIETCYDTINNPTAYRKAVPIDITQVRDSMTNTGRGSLRFSYYYVYGFGSNIKIGTIPIPQQNSTNGLRLWHVDTVSNLILPADTINIPNPDRYGRGIALQASGVLLRKGQQEDANASRYLAEAEGLKEKMKEELMDRVADDQKVIIDSIGFNTDFGEPFIF